MGPGGFSSSRWCTCAPPIRFDPRGWAKFNYVKMPEYRWGHPAGAAGRETRVIPFGENYGQAGPGRKVPRASIAPRCRRLIVIQGDTEGPASVEQQRPSRQDRRPSAPTILRNLFPRSMSRRAATSGAMVYLLQKYFRPRRAREEADDLFAPPLPVTADSPRMPRGLQRGNARLAVVLHVHLFLPTRDGKMQLQLAGAIRLRSACSPPPCRFMLTERSPPHVRRREPASAASCSAPARR